MVLLKYVGMHQPNTIHEIEGKDVDRYLKTGEYKIVDNEGRVKIQEVMLPDESWTEAKIAKWIGANNVPIQYKPEHDTKKSALEKIQRYVNGGQ